MGSEPRGVSIRSRRRAAILLCDGLHRRCDVVATHDKAAMTFGGIIHCNVVVRHRDDAAGHLCIDGAVAIIVGRCGRCNMAQYDTTRCDEYRCGAMRAYAIRPYIIAESTWCDAGGSRAARTGLPGSSLKRVAAQSQGVADDKHRAERHGARRDDRAELPA